MSGRLLKRTAEPNDEEQPAPKLSKQAGEESKFSKPWKGSDAVLVVEDKELHVHTTVLSLASPVFEAMFSGRFKEAETKRVTLEGKSYDLIEHMLKIVYPSKAKLGEQ